MKSKSTKSNGSVLERSTNVVMTVVAILGLIIVIVGIFVGK